MFHTINSHVSYHKLSCLSLRTLVWYGLVAPLNNIKSIKIVKQHAPKRLSGRMKPSDFCCLTIKICRARLINSLRALSNRMSHGRNPLNPPYQGDLQYTSYSLTGFGRCQTLSDFEDLGWAVVVIAETGEVVPAACEFEEKGFVCLFF